MKYLAALILTSLGMHASIASGAVSAEKKVSRTIPVPNKDPWDYDVHGGAGFGDFTLKNGVKKSYGGYVAGATVYNESIFDNQTVYVSGDMLIDQANQQVIRKGFSLGTNYALIGGKKRIIERLKPGAFVSQNNFFVTWNNRLSYDSYSVTSTKLGIETLDGSVVSLLTGVGINMFISTQMSLGISLMQSVMSFSASVEKSSATTTELSVAFRTYL